VDTVGFWDWVNEVKNQRRLSFRAIERAAGVSNGAISKRESDGLDPTLDTLQAISTAFDLPLQTVLERAGLLSKSDSPPSLREAQYLFAQLTGDEQELFLAQMRAALELRRNREKNPNR